MGSKLHGVCHSKGGPLQLHLPEGQCSDFTGADGVLKDLPAAAAVVGDQGSKSARCWPSRAFRLASRPIAAPRNQSMTIGEEAVLPQFWIRSRGGCDAGHGVGDADVANVDLGLCQGVSRQA